jgi:hypothetical protein
VIRAYHHGDGSGGSPPPACARVSQVAEEARALGKRLLSRRYDDPPHTIAIIDSGIAELAALRRVAVDAEDMQALQEVLAEFAEIRRRLES